jgi:glutamyl-tRNA synthetase
MNTSALIAAPPKKLVRTRFAPSPTGYLHLGGARTALFSWAYARRFGGSFVLRIEDTDLRRSTPEAVNAILNGMHWLGLQHNEGPFYQMQRVGRYQEVITQMLREGTAYYCYSSPEEIELMRKNKILAGSKPRYDGKWRPENGKILPPVPTNREPVVRFKNPINGTVSWDDLIKGTIAVSNCEMDDLIIARADATPTYNFCVAVDDLDMQITHVLRGDDHVNNTPRQINILKALGGTIPSYGHLSMVLGSNGEKLSKRRGDTVSVMEYAAQGYLPEAILNYLARLGWSYGDQEMFSMEQFCTLFNLDNVSKSPAQFNVEKLDWINKYYLRLSDNEKLAAMVKPLMEKEGVNLTSHPDLSKVVELVKKRSHTINKIAAEAMFFYHQPAPDLRLLTQYLTQEVKLPLVRFLECCSGICWNKENLSALVKRLLLDYQLKMPAIAMPLRLIVTGQLETPAVDAVFEVLGRETVIKRLRKYIK